MASPPPPVLAQVEQLFPNPFRTSPPAASTVAGADVVVSDVTASFDIYRQTFKTTLPRNVNRARAAVAAFRKAVR